MELKYFEGDSRTLTLKYFKMNFCLHFIQVFPKSRGISFFLFVKPKIECVIVLEKKGPRLGLYMYFNIFLYQIHITQQTADKKKWKFYYFLQKLFQPFPICNSLSTSTLVERISLFQLSLVFLINQEKFSNETTYRSRI